MVRYSRRNRVRRRRRRSVRVALALTLLLTVTLGVFSLASRHSSSSSYSSPEPANLYWTQGNTSDKLAMLALPAPRADRRPVYRYSVVPGGVHGPEELQQASMHDRVVAQHYAGFDYKNARVVQLTEARMVYLSYRLGDKIYWTKKKVSLRKGEKVITDGKMTARTRCANQVSEKAQPQVSPQEPPAAAFEEPIADGGSATQIPFPGNFESTLLGRPEPGLGGTAPGLLTSSLYPPNGAGGYPGIAPPPLPFPGCETEAQEKNERSPDNEKNETPCATGGGPPPPPPVPEPGTIMLVASGVAGIYLRYRKSSARK